MPAGRPTKINQKVVDTFKEVVDDEVLYCTDEDLFLLFNEKLAEKDRITYRTFQRWKAGEHKEHNELFNEFCRVIKKALVKEKRNLLNQLKKDDKAWQRWAWIIERKFDEWNIKHKQEHDHSGEMSFKGIPPIEWAKDGKDQSET